MQETTPAVAEIVALAHQANADGVFDIESGSTRRGRGPSAMLTAVDAGTGERSA